MQIRFPAFSFFALQRVTAGNSQHRKRIQGCHRIDAVMTNDLLKFCFCLGRCVDRQISQPSRVDWQHLGQRPELIRKSWGFLGQPKKAQSGTSSGPQPRLKRTLSLPRCSMRHSLARAPICLSVFGQLVKTRNAFAPKTLAVNARIKHGLIDRRTFCPDIDRVHHVDP